MTKREGRTFWTDHQGDLIADEWWGDDDHVMVAKSGRMFVPVYLPTEPADIDRMLAALADAMGREPCEGGFRAKPRPFRVGDVVKRSDVEAVVLSGPWDDLGDASYLVDLADDAGGLDLWPADDITLITPAEEVEQQEESAPEGEWRTPSAEECAAAVEAGVLEVRLGDGWCQSINRPSDFDVPYGGLVASAYRVPAGWSA